MRRSDNGWIPRGHYFMCDHQNKQFTLPVDLADPFGTMDNDHIMFSYLYMLTTGSSTSRTPRANSAKISSLPCVHAQEAQRTSYITDAAANIHCLNLLASHAVKSFLK